jgi:hypothetical protein
MSGSGRLKDSNAMKAYLREISMILPVEAFDYITKYYWNLVHFGATGFDQFTCSAELANQVSAFMNGPVIPGKTKAKENKGQENMYTRGEVIENLPDISLNALQQIIGLRLEGIQGFLKYYTRANFESMLESLELRAPIDEIRAFLALGLKGPVSKYVIRMGIEAYSDLTNVDPAVPETYVGIERLQMLRFLDYKLVNNIVRPSENSKSIVEFAMDHASTGYRFFGTEGREAVVMNRRPYVNLALFKLALGESEFIENERGLRERKVIVEPRFETMEEVSIFLQEELFKMEETEHVFSYHTTNFIRRVDKIYHHDIKDLLPNETRLAHLRGAMTFRETVSVPVKKVQNAAKR